MKLFQKTGTLSLGMIGLAALLLAGCNNPDSSSDGANIVAIGATTTPSVANLTGTWSGSRSWTDTLGAYTQTVDFEFTSDAKFAIYVKSEKPAATSYTAYQGTYTLDGDQLALTSDGCYSSTTPFVVDELLPSAWSTDETNEIHTICMSEGTCYGLDFSVFKASGLVDGLVGTWVEDEADSSLENPFTRLVYTFSANGAVTVARYQSTTATFDTAAGTAADSYVINADGTFTLIGSTASHVGAIKGDYMIFFSTIAFTKQ